MSYNNTMKDYRKYAVRVYSEIGRKWVRHQATALGVTREIAQKLVDSFKEVKGEIVPFTPEREIVAIPWLMIDAVRA